jgi:peroxiredoxin family protein
MEVMKLQQNMRDGVSLIMFSGEMDRMLAAFTIALGAAAAGSPVTMFFTFWGLNLLRKKRITAKLLPQKMLQVLQAPGGEKRPLSKFNFLGAGRWMMKKLMTRFNMPDVEEMFAQAVALDVEIIACSTSMAVMGIGKEDLREEVSRIAGVASFLESAEKSHTQLFI